MSLSSAAFKRLSKELTTLSNSPPEGIRVQLDESNILNVNGWIEGPSGTPYAGGFFKIRFQFGPDFPAAPPKCHFATKIFHPNVAPSTGEICVSTLKKDWKKEYGVGHILITVKCLLIHPNPESALHEEAGKLLLEAYDDYAKHAKLMTDVHAKHRPLEFNTPSATEDASPSGSHPSFAKRIARASSLTPAPIHSTSSSNIPDSSMFDVEPSDAIKPTTSAAMASSLSSTIPQKRPAPAQVSTLGTAATVPPGIFPHAPSGGVLGASSNASSGCNTIPVKKTTTGAAQTNKKKSLKRL